MNWEVECRANVVGTFPNDASILRPLHGYSTELWICSKYNGCPFSNDFQPNPDIPPIECFEFCTKPGQTIVDQIAPGRWTIRVIPTEVDQWTFRMRTKLEVSPRDAKTGPTRLLPNLRPMEPFAFTFTAPAVDNASNPAGLPAGAPVTCTASEYADDAHVCLRFSGGAGNHGPGDFRVHPCKLGDDLDLWTACQRVYRSDGTFEDQPTGARLVYEDAHAHWHYSDFLTYELFRVTGLGPTKLAETSAGRKTGFCPVDERMVGSPSSSTRSWAPRVTGPSTRDTDPAWTRRTRRWACPRGGATTTNGSARASSSTSAWR